MPETFSRENLKNMADEDLVELLFIEGDELPMTVVVEFISRGNRMIDYLNDIIMNVRNWQRTDVEWWAILHATFILGAIGGKEAITPLIASMKFADVYEVDWLWETLPSILGKIGPAALEPLRTVVLDKSNPWMTRTAAFDAMAAVTVGSPGKSSEVFDFIASILKDRYEDMTVRGFAGSVLLDFQLEKYKKSILEFIEDEERLAGDDPTYDYHFDREDVERSFAPGAKKLGRYTKEWLNFYDEKEIEARQKRWKEENSWLYPVKSWWRMRRLKRVLNKIKEKGITKKEDLIKFIEESRPKTDN